MTALEVGLVIFVAVESTAALVVAALAWRRARMAVRIANVRDSERERTQDNQSQSATAAAWLAFAQTQGHRGPVQPARRRR